MRRAPVVFVALATLGLLAGCASDDAATSITTNPPSSMGTATSSTPPSTTLATDTSAPTETTTTGVAAEPIDEAGCARYITLTQLFDDLEVIAAGANSTQVAADTELAASIDDLRDQPGAGSDKVTDALDTLAAISFQATDSADGPTAQERFSALATLDTAFGPTCT